MFHLLYSVAQYGIARSSLTHTRQSLISELIKLNCTWCNPFVQAQNRHHCLTLISISLRFLFTCAWIVYKRTLFSLVGYTHRFMAPCNRSSCWKKNFVIHWMFILLNQICHALSGVTMPDPPLWASNNDCSMHGKQNRYFLNFVIFWFSQK